MATHFRKTNEAKEASEATAQRLHVTVHGRVQGVFFRTSAQKRAIELGLTGWVRNDPAGTVSLAAEGPEERLKEFLEWCYTGSRWTHADRVDFKWQRATGEYNDFYVR